MYLRCSQGLIKNHSSKTADKLLLSNNFHTFPSIKWAELGLFTDDHKKTVLVATHQKMKQSTAGFKPW